MIVGAVEDPEEEDDEAGEPGDDEGKAEQDQGEERELLPGR